MAGAVTVANGQHQRQILVAFVAPPTSRRLHEHTNDPTRPEHNVVDMSPLQPPTKRHHYTEKHQVTALPRPSTPHPPAKFGSDTLGAAGSQVGPVAKGWAAWLHYGLGLSFAKCAALLARLGIDVTAGALCQAAQTTGFQVKSAVAVVGGGGGRGRGRSPDRNDPLNRVIGCLVRKLRRLVADGHDAGADNHVVPALTGRAVDVIGL